MLSDTIQAALNVQINEELHSAYIYLAMAAESDRLGLPCLLYTSDAADE